MNALSILNQLPETKDEIKSFVQAAIYEITEGHAEPLQMIKNIAAIEKTFKAIKADNNVKEVILKEAEKYGGKSFDAFNCKYQVKETGVKYDYSQCGDTTLNDLYLEMEILKEKIKERENFLKSLKPDMQLVDADTGVYLMPPSKRSTTSVTVTLK